MARDKLETQNIDVIIVAKQCRDDNDNGNVEMQIGRKIKSKDCRPPSPQKKGGGQGWDETRSILFAKISDQT